MIRRHGRRRCQQNEDWFCVCPVSWWCLSMCNAGLETAGIEVGGTTRIASRNSSSPGSTCTLFADEIAEMPKGRRTWPPAYLLATTVTAKQTESTHPTIANEAHGYKGRAPYSKEAPPAATRQPTKTAARQPTNRTSEPLGSGCL